MDFRLDFKNYWSDCFLKNLQVHIPQAQTFFILHALMKKAACEARVFYK